MIVDFLYFLQFYKDLQLLLGNVFEETKEKTDGEEKN